MNLAEQMKTTPQIRTATIKPGDHVRLAGGPSIWLTVEDVSDPALVTLRAPGGALVKAGRQTISEVSRPAR